MDAPKVPDKEELRLACLAELDILDTPSEPVYDRITELASELLDVPIALVSIVDKQRQWFKSKVGLDAAETSRDISFCGHVVYSNEPLVINDTLDDPRFADNPLVTDGPMIRFYAGMPISIAPDITLGTLCIIDTKPRQLDEQQLSILQKLSSVVIEIFNHERAALKDHLTGVFNRRMLDNLGSKFISEFNRSDTAFSVISFDIDYFKAINDEHGHDAGDRVLIGIANAVSGAMRGQDYLFRTGGEEFLVLVPGSTLDQATEYAERLRHVIAANGFLTNVDGLTLTASFGVAEYHKSDRYLQTLLKRADTALYDAKAAGRDNVKVSRLPD